jgi:hypothetical protein
MPIALLSLVFVAVFMALGHAGYIMFGDSSV